jgi:hypothetical protein
MRRMRMRMARAWAHCLNSEFAAARAGWAGPGRQRATVASPLREARSAPARSIRQASLTRRSDAAELSCEKSARARQTPDARRHVPLPLTPTYAAYARRYTQYPVSFTFFQGVWGARGAEL